MKVIIDLIEDMRNAIENNSDFFLRAMNLYETASGELVPSWQTDIESMKVDDKEKKLYIFLGVEPMGVPSVMEKLDALSNEQMMYEINLSYYKDEARRNAPIIGFGESFKDKKYLVFISE